MEANNESAFSLNSIITFVAYSMPPFALEKQLLAYYVAVNKGRNVDQPRNLAKSVTVE